MSHDAWYSSPDGVLFSTREVPCRQIYDVQEYRFDDIGPNDRVLDIGANVGAFCIRAARITPYVVAVEPVVTDILEENIRTNHVPVTVIRGALGDGGPADICWDDCRVVSGTYTLGDLIEIAGRCDFLKCDCEGAEWTIDPADLAGIRRIEMELHMPPIGGVPKPELLDYLGNHYRFEIERKPFNAVMGVMGVLHAYRKTAK